MDCVEGHQGERWTMGSMGEDLTNWTIDQWTPIGPSPYSLAWDNGSQSVVVSPSEDGRTSFGLNNILYYLFLVPIGLLCNALTFTVVVIIMRNRRSRQSVPDACVCLLTAIDLLSILFIHSPTILASAAGRWSSVQTPPPTKLCVYQAFATSVYLKFQFLVQVTMALDRFFAITTPLNYHRLQSFTTFKIIIAATVTASVSSTALLFAFDAGRLRDITTWGFCYFEWQLQSTADYVINIGITLIFAAGFLAFLFSNAALVRFFWLYDFHKAEILVRDISKAMKAVEKTEKQESEWGAEGGRAPCAEGEQVAMIDVTMRDQQRSPPHLNVGDDVIDCSAAKDNRLLSNEDESMTNQRRPIDDDNMTTTELTTQHINPQDTRDCAWPTGEGTVKGAVEGSRGWCSVDEDDGSSAIGRAIDGNPLDDDAGLRCHGFTKQKLNNKGATEINDRYDDAIEQTLNTDVALIGPTTVTNALDQPSHHQHQRNQSIHLPILSRRSSLIHPLHVACLDHGPHADHGPYSVHATHSDHVTHPDHRRHRGGSGLLRMSETPNRSTLMSSKTKAEVSDVDVAALHLRNCWSLSTITGGCADHASPPDDKRNHFIPCKQVIRRGNRSLPPVRRFHPSRPAAPAAVEQATEAAPAETLQTTDDSEKVSQSIIYILERIRNLVERSKRNTRRQNRQLVLLKCVLLCSFVFVVTWLPYTVSLHSQSMF